MKGQGKYVIGVFVMVAAIAIGLVGETATEYTLSVALTSMDENFARYDSMVHSYMILNDGTNGVANHEDMADDLTSLSHDQQCSFDGSWGVDHGSSHRVTFTNLEGAVGNGDCSVPPGYYYDDDISFDSPGLFAVPYYGVYPDMAFYSPADGGKNFYMHTRVKPERDN